MEDQIRRECVLRGFPEVRDLKRLERIPIGKGRESGTLRFHRFRSRRGLTQPDRLGSFWCIRFDEPVPGPLALGFAAHFGLGLFRPCLDPR